MAKVLESSLGTYGFELQSPYYEQLQTNTHGKNTNHFIHPSIFWIPSLLFFEKDGFNIKITQNDWYAIKQRNQTKIMHLR